MKYLLILYYLFFEACFAKNLPEYLEQMNSYSATFKQTITHHKKIIQVTNGTLQFLRPAYFIWETKIPDQKIVADGKNIYIYDKDLEQVIKKPQQLQLDNTPAMFLVSNPQSLNKHFKIKNCANTSNCFNLLALKQQASYQNIKLQFDKNAQLHQLSIIDALGQKTVIEFQIIRKNPILKPANFEFKIPKNVDLVE